MSPKCCKAESVHPGLTSDTAEVDPQLTKTSTGEQANNFEATFCDTQSPPKLQCRPIIGPKTPKRSCAEQKEIISVTVSKPGHARSTNLPTPHPDDGRSSQMADSKKAECCGPKIQSEVLNLTRNDKCSSRGPPEEQKGPVSEGCCGKRNPTIPSVDHIKDQPAWATNTDTRLESCRTGLEASSTSPRIPAATDPSCCPGSQQPRMSEPTLEFGKKAGCCSSTTDPAAQERKEKSCCRGDLPLRLAPAGDATETKVSVVSVVEGDDKICPCCIGLAIKAMLGKPSQTSFTHLLAQSTSVIRRCCQLFDKHCSQKTCCMRMMSKKFKENGLEHTVAEPVIRSASVKVGTQSSTNEKDGLLSRAVFRLDGMDCASCSIKVTRATSRLTSVQRVNVDYFASNITLEHDPEQVTLDAIARFVSRATGFKVTPLLDPHENASGVARLSLPIATTSGTILTQDDTNKYTVVSRGSYAEVCFDPRIHPPRSVMRDLERFGPKLIPREKANDCGIIARRALLESFVRSITCTICVVPILVLTWGNPNPSFAAIHGTAAGLSTVILGLSTPLLIGSIKSLAYLQHADIQLLVAVSVLTAYVFSVVAFALNLRGNDFEHPFFETPALLLTLVHMGALVQAYARRLVGLAVDALETAQPESVRVLNPAQDEKDETARWSSIDTRLLEYGDIVRVESDETIAADGFVLNHGCIIDESCVTGESMPVAKQIGDLVVAGCTNVGPPCDIHVSRLVHENTAAKMAGLVNQVQQTRLPIQDGADRIAAVLLPCTLAVAAVSLLVWSLVARYVRDQSGSSAGVSGLTYAIAVVAVACPCALVLAAPLVITTVISIGLRAGVVFRSTSALWTFHDVDTFAFDKTGTLTEGRMTVEKHYLIDSQAGSLVAALVVNQTHPISKAVARAIGVDPATMSFIKQAMSEVSVVPGQGLESTFAGFPLLGGSATFVRGGYEDEKNDPGDGATSVFMVTLGGQIIAWFRLSDRERFDAHDLVRTLTQAGKRVVIISGDLPGPVDRIADKLEVLPENTHSQCSPTQKLEIIRELQKDNKKVCYIGDGANDAPALAAADISIAIGDGAGIAQATADIIIVSDRHLKASILSALGLARINRYHVLAAFAWSIFYNVFAILLASGAFVTVRIAPQWAGLGELASILPIFVIAFSTKLSWKWRREGLAG